MTHRAARRTTTLLAALALLALAATGCGGATATTDDRPAGPPAATAPPEDDPADRPDDTTDGSGDDTTDGSGDEAADGSTGGSGAATGTPTRPAAQPSAAPAGGGSGEGIGGAAEDGTHPSYIVKAEAETLTVDRIEILSGAAAAAARAEDGEPDAEPGVDLPYLRNRNPRLRALPVAADVRVQVYDCSGGCTLVPCSYADLVAGRALPYGSPDSPFEVTVRDGRVVEVAEVYLP